MYQFDVYSNVLTLFYVCVCMSVLCVCHDTRMEVREQLLGVGSFFPHWDGSGDGIQVLQTLLLTRHLVNHIVLI